MCPADEKPAAESFAGLLLRDVQSMKKMAGESLVLLPESLSYPLDGANNTFHRLHSDFSFCFGGQSIEKKMAGESMLPLPFSLSLSLTAGPETSLPEREYCFLLSFL